MSDHDGPEAYEWPQVTSADVLPLRCPTCRALVAPQDQADHDGWHRQPLDGQALERLARGVRRLRDGAASSPPRRPEPTLPDPGVSP